MTIDTSQNSTFVGSITAPSANIRVVANLSNSIQDGMWINYGSLGGTNAHCRFFANGITRRMHINAFTGNVGIAANAGAAYRLQVNGKIHCGGSLGPTVYGQLQITRPTTQPDTGHYISMVRGGNMVSAFGYVNSTNKVYIKNEFTATATNNGIYIDTDKVGINKQSPAYALDVAGDINIPFGSNYRINRIPIFITSGTNNTVVGFSPLLSAAQQVNNVFGSIFSDDRLKHNEIDIADGLSTIMLLNPPKYDKPKSF